MGKFVVSAYYLLGIADYCGCTFNVKFMGDGNIVSIYDGLIAIYDLLEV